MSDQQKLLRSIYFDPNNPGSFGGITKLYAAARKVSSAVTIRDVKKFLASVDAYTLHREKRKRFQKNRFILKGIDDLWQADLADMTSLARYNSGTKFLLVVIDCFSKYLWVTPLKSKGAAEVLKGFKTIIEKAAPRIPNNWQVDKGTEFQNTQIRDYTASLNINFYKTQNSETKAAFAERVIRTIKGKIYRYMAKQNNWGYVDALPMLVASYNSSKHRSIGMAPKDVNQQNERTILKKMFSSRLRMIHPKFKYSVGDTVRIAKERGAFDKGYHPGWTEEIFTISKQIGREPPVYKIKDVTGIEVEGTFYEAEIQAVIPPTDGYYKVEKVLKTRRRGQKVEYLIKWYGYPISMATWEPVENVTIISGAQDNEL